MTHKGTKSIIIYSGKGGVGKTTTTANLAIVLCEMGKKVFILDADVNTPSMNSIFTDSHPNENLMIESLGYTSDGLIFIQSSLIRKYIKTAIEKIKEFSPDFVLIDTPPSITDVHISLIESIKASGLIIVTQPTNISENDVRRTAVFFNGRQIKTIGIIENMSISDERQYSINLLGRIPFVQGFDNDQILKSGREVYKNITQSIIDVESVIMENDKKNPINSQVQIEDIKMWLLQKNSSKNFYSIMRFYNVETWEYVREELIKKQMMFGRPDKRLENIDANCIARILNSFEDDTEAYFMISRAPNTDIFLLSGEIGQGSLFFGEASSYYGLPRIKYHTTKGDVHLFPDEVIPMSVEDIQCYVNEGYMISKDGRYIPTKEHVRMIYNAFGSRVGISSNWEEKYDLMCAI